MGEGKWDYVMDNIYSLDMCVHVYHLDIAFFHAYPKEIEEKCVFLFQCLKFVFP